MLALTLALAWPLLFVTTTVPPGKPPLATLTDTANVTLTLGTALLKTSRTVATSGFVNAVVTVALWLAPEATAMLFAAPAVLVKRNGAKWLTATVSS